MPRKLRLGYPGTMYHVMSRGDQREDIFLDDADRHDFIKTLAEACQKTDWCKNQSPQVHERPCHRQPADSIGHQMNQNEYCQPFLLSDPIEDRDKHNSVYETK